MAAAVSIGRLRRLRAAGATLDEIAEILGVSRMTVARRCSEHGIPAVLFSVKGKKASRAWRSVEAGKLYRHLYWDRGMTMKEIAFRSGLNEEAMRQRFLHHGIGRRPRGTRPRVKA